MPYENFKVFIYGDTAGAEEVVPMDFPTIFDAHIYATFLVCGAEFYYSPSGIHGIKPKFISVTDTGNFKSLPKIIYE